MNEKADASSTRDNYKKFIWVELIVFDPTLPDFGAGRYLDTVGFKVDAILLDIRYSDFTHEHVRAIDDTPIDYKYCANYKRPGGHTWTRRQLRSFSRSPPRGTPSRRG